MQLLRFAKINQVLPCLITAALGTTKVARNIRRRLTGYVRLHVMTKEKKWIWPWDRGAHQNLGVAL